jgi:hypothetical protein
MHIGPVTLGVGVRPSREDHRLAASGYEERLHGALNYQTPSTWCRGNPEQLRQERRKKVAMGRHRRKQVNLGIRQPTFPQTSPESVLYN